MPYKLQVAEKDVFGKGKFAGNRGQTPVSRTSNLTPAGQLPVQPWTQRMMGIFT